MLTAARLVAVVPFALLLARANDGVSVGAAVLFAVASLTDFLDGYLARRYAFFTRFGRIADPLADRLLIDIALVLLIWHDRLEWWLALPVLLRDALLAALFRVNVVGKSATAAIMTALALLMLTAAPWPKVLFAFGLALSVCAAVLYYRGSEGGLPSRPS